jgi:hypothetical protein
MEDRHGPAYLRLNLILKSSGIKTKLQLMKVRKKILGSEYEDTVDGMAMMGLTYGLNSRWDDAEKLEV